MSEKVELKPCPFCGGEAAVINNGKSECSVWIEHTAVQCVKCFTTVGLARGGKQKAREKMVIAFWNARPTAWIPVSERLPEDSRTVLVTFIDDADTVRTWTAKYYGEEFWVDGDIVGELKGLKILAWQPLPEPFQPEK